MTSKTNLKIVLREEVALEGLDGITFQALWIRLSEATTSKLPYSDSFKQYVWQLIKLIPHFEYYELQEPRPDLVPFNRYLEREVPADIYPHSAIEDTVKNIKGSCSTYHTRINITEYAKPLSYEEIYNTYGSKFVIVASQKQREEILFDSKSYFSNITVVRHCMLERIGRSRYNGEITFGKNSLLALGEEPKSLFYHRKTLLEENVIKKQTFNRRFGTHSYNGTLLHLKRFYKEDIPKSIKLTEIVVDYLKEKPNFTASYEEVKYMISKKNFKKLIKAPEFIKYVEPDLFIPYRELFPNSIKEDWQLKSNKKEKKVHVIKLKDPNKTVENSMKIEPSKIINNQSKLQSDAKIIMNKSYLTQTCHAVKTFGSNGCSETELREYLGATRLTTRILIRNLVRKNMLASFLVDDGRQRINRYCYKEFEHDGEYAQKFDMQRKETLELLLNNIESNSSSNME